MTDSYLAIAEIADDEAMNERMNACVMQQVQLGTISPRDPLSWVSQQRYTWAASPGWGEAWTYAKSTHTGDQTYEPGRDEAVITDAMILATVQALGKPNAGMGKPEKPVVKAPTATTTGTTTTK